MLNARHWPRVLRGGSVLGDSLLSCSHAGCNLGGGSVQVHLFLGFMITLGRSLGQFYTMLCCRTGGCVTECSVWVTWLG